MGFKDSFNKRNGLSGKDEKQKACDKDTEIDSKDASTWNDKGNALYNSGKYEEALQICEKVLDLDPKYLNAWYNKGIVLSKLGRSEEALQAYNQVLDLDPNDVNAWNNKGVALYNLGKSEEALQAYDKALDFDPKYVNALNNKGFALYNLGKSEEALKTYDKALDLDPKYANTWYNKGIVFSKLGRYEEAIKCYTRVKELKPEAKDIEEKLADAKAKSEEASLNTLKREIEDAGRYILVPAPITEVAEKGVSQKVDVAREQLQKLISEAEPLLSVELSRTSLNLNEWCRSSIKIVNQGNAHAFDVVLSFSDDFEVRSIIPVSINAGDKKDLEIALRSLVKGDLPLEIVAKYGNGREKNYESRYSFWIDVKGDKNEQGHSSKPGNTGTIPSTFPEELAEKYTNIEYIGGGGFARVFKAKRLDGKPAAIKLPSSSDAITGKSFINELKNWTELEHENIVKVYDYNILPVPYFEMELCDCALSEKKFPLDATSSAGIIFNVCEGLKYAHSKSIIHQDLKPHNILLKEGLPKISDWGLSKVATTSGTSLKGGYTPLYAAPEQISKKLGKKNSRTDIWQVGVLFYEIITGKMPFEGDSPVMIMSSITMEEPEPPSSINPEVEKLDPIIMKCLEKKQEMRYQSVSELQKDLAEFLRIDYTQSLKMSISQNDMKRSAFYCGDLLIIHLKLGELADAYKYAGDLSHYAKGEIKDLTNEFCTQLEVRIDNGMHDVPVELMKKAEIIAHKVGLGYSRISYEGKRTDSIKSQFKENSEYEAFQKKEEEQRRTKKQDENELANSIGMEFVKIPSGEFMMGSNKYSEQPVHKVTIRTPFLLGKYPVTQKQWVKVMDSNNPSRFKGDDLPIECVSWDDVQKFIQKLNQMEGTDEYRLPSEAEWEYACRAGTTTKYYFGDEVSRLEEYAWYKRNSSEQTHPVGQKKPNPWGLYDMNGNVWEWVQDSRHKDYEGASLDGSAWENDGITKVARGGSWYDDPRFCRSSSRTSASPKKRTHNNLGVRILREI